MSMKVHAAHAPLRPAGMEVWGEMGPEGEPNLAIRFILPDRTVCFPAAEIKRWEHVRSTPERLIITCARERITVTGLDLVEIRVAMDRYRLRELRVTGSTTDLRQEPRIKWIEFESL